MRGAWSSIERSDLHRVLLSVLIAAGVFAGLFILWRVREALLLTFAAVIVAVLLIAATGPIKRHSSLSHRWALTAVGVVAAILLALMLWLVGAQVQQQVSELSRQLPQAINSVEQSLGVQITDGRGQGAGGVTGTIGAAVRTFFGQIASFGTAFLGALASIILVVAGGFFLAADPDLYRRGIVKLFPKNQHGRVAETLDASGGALRLWLIAELISMAIVGVLVGLGTWLIGLPAPLALGLFAGLTEFVPFIGPFIGAVPALLLALTEGGSSFIWTALLFIGVQQLESNVIAPIVEREMVHIPPALLLFGVVALGLLFGILGVIVAAPLAVVLYVAVKKLYVRDLLHEETSIPGES